MDRHRLDVDPDPDTNFHVNAGPDSGPDWHQKIRNDANPRADPTSSFTLLENQNIFYFLSQLCQFSMFYLSHQCQMCPNFHKLLKQTAEGRRILLSVYNVNKGKKGENNGEKKNTKEDRWK